MNSVVAQDKLYLLAFDHQTAIGTATAASASSVILPAFDITLAADQGRGLISRANVMDGYPGEAVGVIGDLGYSLAFAAETHQLGDAVIPYYVSLFLMCGHKATVVNTDRYAITPTPEPAVAWTQGAQGWAGAAPVAYSDDLLPTPLTFHKITNNNGIWDYAEHVHDVIGSITFGGESGDRLVVGVKAVGLIGSSGLIDSSDTDLADIGAYQTGYGTPIIIKGCTLTVTMNSDDISAPVAKFALDQGAATPLVKTAAGTYGFAIAPSFVEIAPKVAFTLAENDVNYARVRNAFLNGYTGVFTVVMASGAQQITLNVPMTQFAKVPTITGLDGYRAFDLEANCVRPPHSATAPYTITIDPTP